MGVKNNQKGIVNIKGKEYQTVAYRIHEFRKNHSIDDYWGIVTELVECSKERVIIKAVVVAPDGKVVATGYAHETWTGNINVTSAVENGETSAIGRALANTGLGGENYCSAEEVQNALAQKPKPPVKATPGSMIKACHGNLDLQSLVEQWFEERPVAANRKSWEGIIPLIHARTSDLGVGATDYWNRFFDLVQSILERESNED